MRDCVNDMQYSIKRKMKDFYHLDYGDEGFIQYNLNDNTNKYKIIGATKILSLDRRFENKYGNNKHGNPCL